MLAASASKSQAIPTNNCGRVVQLPLMAAAPLDLLRRVPGPRVSTGPWLTPSLWCAIKGEVNKLHSKLVDLAS